VISYQLTALRQAQDRSPVRTVLRLPVSFASADAKAMAGQVDPASSPQEENVEVPKLDLGELSRVEASPTLCGRDARVPSTSATLKTQGVRPPRGTNAQVLQDLAKKAARSNSRNDVQEYMRLRRDYV
jgi:hypothetical protein